MPGPASAEAVALGLALADRLPACLGLMEGRIQRIDQANPVYAPIFDLSGQRRRGPPDIGAYEYRGR